MRVSRIVTLVAFISVAAIAQAQPTARASSPSEAQMSAMSDAQFSAFLGAIPAERRLSASTAATPIAGCPWSDNNGIVSQMMSFFASMFGGA